MQNIRIYQTADNTSTLKSPLYSHVREDTDPDFPWMQPGFYFWEHYPEDAEEWGRIRRYDGFTIYSSSYNMDDQFCLDLVSNYRHKDLFFKARDRLMKNNRGSVTIEKIIKLILDNKPIFKCVRLQSKAFHFDKIEVPTPNNHTVVFFPTTVQVCFYEFPNSLITENFKIHKRYEGHPVFG